MYRVYADGRELGIDYATLDEAQQVRDEYAADFPHVRYYIRKVS